MTSFSSFGTGGWGGGKDLIGGEIEVVEEKAMAEMDTQPAMFISLSEPVEIIQPSRMTRLATVITEAGRFITDAAVGVPKLMISDAKDTINKIVNRVIA